MSEIADCLPKPTPHREGAIWEACGARRGGLCQCGTIWSLELDAPIIQVLRRHEENEVDYPRELVEKHARLAEAAPELLQSLQDLVREHGEGLGQCYKPGCVWCKAEALIARAKGP